jgi:hypothetical protein
MIFLVISMITMKFIRPVGVPWGRRCDSICLGVFVQPYIMMANHTERAKGRLTDRWAVLENTWGYRAIKFSGRIVTINRIRILCDLFELFPRV